MARREGKAAGRVLPPAAGALTLSGTPLERLEAWFVRQGWTPFGFQREAWAAYARGESGLINVPTGAGKTYAALGGPLLDLMADPPEPGTGVRVVYVSPMRAVGRDIELALRRPIEDMALPIRVESRTGDTSASARQRQRRTPPEVLVTTPESLWLMLADDAGPKLFSGLRAIILDEWHELLATKRGTQTELAAARLRRWSPALRTWALSATLRNLPDAARAAVGALAPEPVIIRAQMDRPIVLRPVLPSQPGRLPWAGHMGLRMLPDLLAALDPAAATLIFCNTRAQAELWHQAIRFERPEWASTLALHHGSLERAERERVEAGVKAGSIRLVVCTSSLDLGVDFAPVERVVQIGSPKGIARLLQRAGRSGHRPGESSTILCVPTHQMELVEIAAVRRALARGEIEPRPPLDKPLDVLAQHLVTSAIGPGFDEAELLEEVRSTRAFATLTDEEFAWAMSLVREGGGTLRRYPEYRKIELRSDCAQERPRYRVTSPGIAQLHRMNLGTITQGGSVAIRYASGRRLGSIDEPFITGLEPGQRFLFAGKTVELVRLDAMEAIVRPARGRTTLTPHWSGIRLPISEALSAEIRAVLAEASSAQRERAEGQPGPELEAARELLRIQATLSRLPMPGETLAEVTTSREGRHLFLFPFDGRAVHAGLAALLALRLARLAPATLTTAVNDYGLEILCPEAFAFERLLTPEVFSLDNLARDAMDSVNMAALAKSQFREVARVAGLVMQTYPGSRKSGRQLQASAALLFDVFSEFDPGNLLLEQARREVLERHFERSRLARTMERLGATTLRIVPTDRPTPLSLPLMVERIAGSLSTESLAQRVERMRAAWESGPSSANAQDLLTPSPGERQPRDVTARRPSTSRSRSARRPRW